jgi:A/G-specific adenine glycosylase
MLQQTQVSAVTPYFHRFISRFPDLASLAAATEDEVLTLWAGLGYYARGRNLHKAAQAIAREFGGVFPGSYESVCALPGVGRSTASAICVFAYGARLAILDGNVKRVLARHFGIEGYPGDKPVETLLWTRSEAALPERDIEAYTQGLMDLGAAICVRSRPRCDLCPLGATCVAFRQNRTKDLPAARPAKVMPERTTTMVVLSSQGELMLERRPSSGIWGGLWCFPEVDYNRLAEECLARFGVLVGECERMGDIDHGFTHFRLRITPVVAQTMRSARAEEPGRLWVTVDDALGAAIPAPVKRILDALSAQSPVIN